MVFNGIYITEDEIEKIIEKYYLESETLNEYKDVICEEVSSMNKDVKLLKDNIINCDKKIREDNLKLIESRIDNINKKRKKVKVILKEVYFNVGCAEIIRDYMKSYQYMNQKLFNMYMMIDETVDNYYRFLLFTDVLIRSLDEYYLKQEPNSPKIDDCLILWENYNNMILAYFDYDEVDKKTYGYYIGKIMKNFDDYTTNHNVKDYVLLKCRLNELTCLCRFVYTRKFNKVKKLFEKAMKLPMTINHNYADFYNDLNALI